MSFVNSDGNVIESEICEPPHFKNKEEYNRAAVYHNDNIMEKILSYVPEIEDRLNMRFVSKRFKSLVETSGVVVPSTSDVLCIQVTPLDIYLQMGSFYKWVNVSYRSNSSNIVREQPEPIMKALRKMLSARKIVKKVKIGHYLPCYVHYDKFVITRDLLEHFENFKNLHSLEILGTLINQETMDYLNSNECKFKNRIKNLSFRWMEEGSWKAALVNEGLKTLKIGEFQNLEEIVRKIEELNLMLDTTDIKVYAIDNLDRSVSIMSRLAKHTRKINLQLTEPSSACFGYHLGLWENITSLELQHTLSLHEGTKLVRIFEGIAHLRNLEKLIVVESYSTRKWIGLGRAVENMTKLKDFSITGFPKNTLCMEQFLNLLPLSIEKMEFSYVPFDSEIIHVFTNRFGNNLKNLTISLETKTDKRYDWLFGPIVSKMKLKTFELDLFISCQYIQQFIDNKHMDELSTRVQSLLPKFDQLLQDNFENYENNRGFIKVSKRKTQIDR